MKKYSEIKMEIRAQQGNVRSIAQYAAMGGDLEKCLRLAIANSCVDEIKYLLGKGVMIPDAILHTSDPEIIKMLLAAGANVNVRDNRGHSRLSVACGTSCINPTKSAEIVRILIEGGANVNQGGLTPLMQAAYYGTAEIVRMLIDAGANVNAKDKFGSTALHNAYNSLRKDKDETVAILIEAGADTEAVNKFGLKPGER